MVIKLLSTGIKSEISLIPFFHSADPPLRIKTLLSCLYIYSRPFFCASHTYTPMLAHAHIFEHKCIFTLCSYLQAVLQSLSKYSPITID